MICFSAPGWKERIHVPDEPMVPEDYIWMLTGRVLPPVYVRENNRYNAEINRCTWQPEREFLLDQRHRFIYQALLDDKAKFTPASHPSTSV